MGRSLGSGVAVEIASRRPPRLLILVSPYTSLVDMGRSLVGPLAPVLVPDRFDNLSKIAALTCPIVIVHGTRDEVVPFEMGRRLAAAGRNVRFIPLEGRTHNDLPELPRLLVTRSAARRSDPGLSAARYSASAGTGSSDFSNASAPRRSNASTALSTRRRASSTKSGLRVDGRLARGGLEALVGPVLVQAPRAHVVLQHRVESVDDLLRERGLLDGESRLDPAEEVARHPVGRGEPDLAVAAVLEDERAAVLEEAAHDGAHADRLRDARNAGLQAADAADEEVDRSRRPARPRRAPR